MSITWRVKRRAKTWVQEPLGVILDRVPLRNFGIDEPFSYLGALFTVHRGLSNSNAYLSIRDAATRCSRLSLKPMQRLNLLCSYVLPAFFYRLIADPPGLVALRELDAFLRSLIRTMLHLPSAVASSYVHMRRADGGLGVPRLVDLVRAANVRALAGLARSDDPVLRSVLGDPRVGALASDSAAALGLNWPPRDEDVVAIKSQLRDTDFSGLGSQGKGAACFRRNKLGNKWLWSEGELYPGEKLST
ncbi:uncharacterized protein LOC124358570 [Homalodisca vitripennis]|uniref:uncharacterized protein LOC124358570 n=1 Tax=Homalodisca vitripennis TaxID=197043 RepID=UPI001EEB65EC|nr:uncharacterized protein LOC124358570 [Homalodisca vitripennis]